MGIFDITESMLNPPTYVVTGPGSHSNKSDTFRVCTIAEVVAVLDGMQAQAAYVFETQSYAEAVAERDRRNTRRFTGF